jgi:hypothetical protein
MIKTPGLSGGGINNNTVTIANKSLAYFGYELHPVPAHLAGNRIPIVEEGISPWQGLHEATDHDEWNYYEFPRQGTYKAHGATHGYFHQEHILKTDTDDRIWIYGTFTSADAERLETAVFDDALGMIKSFYLGFEHKVITLALSSAEMKIYDSRDFMLVARPKSWL